VPSTGTAFVWRTSTERFRSGSRSWYAPDPSVRQDVALVSDPISLPAGADSATLTFYHTFEFEPGFDGGVVEISDGGAWQDLGPWMVSGAYTSNVTATLGSPLGTRPVWSGGRLGEFTPVVVDLSGYVGRTVRLRLRATADTHTGGAGWYVDDLRVVATTAECATPGGELPSIASVVYKKGKLKIKGVGFDARAGVEINGRPVSLPFAYRADKGLLKVKATAAVLGLRTPASNRVVVVQGGRASRPFALGL
jgi:hypothetical protein